MGNHDEEHLRRFAAARRRGDAADMRRWWEEVVIDFYPRMDGMVHAAHKGRLDPDEHEDAVTLCLTRFSTRLMDTFAGDSIGELVNACRVLARNICIDVQRASIRRRGPGTASLDGGWDGDASARDAWERDEAERRFQDQETSADLMEFFAWALPQVPESQRRVVELSLDGAALTEIVAELGITEDNAYQRRSRGFAVIRRLKEQFDAP